MPKLSPTKKSSPGRRGLASLWVPKIKGELHARVDYFFFFAVFLAAFFFAGMDASWKTFSLEGFRFGSLNANRHATN
jgi:hypothetical protein